MAAETITKPADRRVATDYGRSNGPNATEGAQREDFGRRALAGRNGRTSWALEEAPKAIAIISRIANNAANAWIIQRLTLSKEKSE